MDNALLPGIRQPAVTGSTNVEAEMRLSMMAMAANRLGEALVPEVKLQLVYVIREMDGGAGQPEESGTIVRIPSIAALEPFYRN